MEVLEFSNNAILDLHLDVVATADDLKDTSSDPVLRNKESTEEEPSDETFINTNEENKNETMNLSKIINFEVDIPKLEIKEEYDYIKNEYDEKIIGMVEASDSEDTEDDSEKNIKFKSSELIQINENPEITLNIPKNAIVDDGKPFRCDLCSKTFDTSNALKIHLYIHPTSNEGNS